MLLKLKKMGYGGGNVGRNRRESGEMILANNKRYYHERFFFLGRLV